MHKLTTLEPRSKISDVHVDVFASWYVCEGCCRRDETAQCPSPGAMYRHLLRHVERGDKVPTRLLEELRAKEGE